MLGTFLTTWVHVFLLLGVLPELAKVDPTCLAKAMAHAYERMAQVATPGTCIELYVFVQ